MGCAPAVGGRILHDGDVAVGRLQRARRLRQGGRRERGLAALAQLPPAVAQQQQHGVHPEHRGTQAQDALCARRGSGVRSSAAPNPTGHPLRRWSAARTSGGRGSRTPHAALLSIEYDDTQATAGRTCSRMRAWGDCPTGHHARGLLRIMREPLAYAGLGSRLQPGARLQRPAERCAQPPLLQRVLLQRSPAHACDRKRHLRTGSHRSVLNPPLRCVPP